MGHPGKRRSIRRRIRKFFSKPLARFAAFVLPYFYYLYMTLVWRTSRVEHYGFRRGLTHRIEYEGLIVALWHETVFFVPYAFRELAVSTLASRSDFGTLIANMLALCGFEVFRGGSSKGGKSRKSIVLGDLIDHMRSHRFVLYGITVDGSRGPARVAKPGVVAIARATGVPIYALHIASRPGFRMRSWDASQIPIPFGRIFLLAEGPIFCAPEATAGEFRESARRLQELLTETALRADAYLDTGELPPRLQPVDPVSGLDPELAPGPSLSPAGTAVRPTPRVTP